MGIMLGTDPEIFLMVGNEYVSAAGIFPGTKKDPFKIEKGAVQVDGVALEFNIDAAANENEFEGNISAVLKQLREMVAQVDKDMRMVFRPIANFENHIWEKISDGDKVLGCDPDYNHAGMVNPNPADAFENTPIRTAAGHIHIGWTEGQDQGNPSHFADCLHIAKNFYARGVYAPRVQDEYNRLKYYGMAGSFRPKSYGVEIRSPSNLWVAEEKDRREMYRKTRKEFQILTGM